MRIPCIPLRYIGYIYEIRANQVRSVNIKTRSIIYHPDANYTIRIRDFGKSITIKCE